ncbi:NADH dehydrogenase [ubiquinone] 1 alpha subcomplex subunit 2 isoform X1 [Python bivittatus]|uniref:NADH dehydrogenase [ubiquinone] 1 alpha subcomplex subunit 2 n=1 Tax=Python bivittatus TaxID=176946 RepID=A0A9F5J3Q8_PYTBI|nr:NADH dehydrogenase [ubiquinone] 1 alpha subcomplex subunit 2 isoform X1 [Python bivittatus]
MDQLLCFLSAQPTSGVAAVGKCRREQCEPHLEFLYKRDFIEQHYVTLKKANPNFPILIRECSNVHPMLWARYAFGLEKSMSLNNLNVEQVAKALENAVNSKI